ncbi:MAG TPA: hypothetical protein VMZ92_21765 [Planctomycetota bacterium]|nr:hypothetical protein [Planctomycetota bacterium]
METDLNYDLMIELRKRETAPDAGRDEHSLSDYVSRFFRDARLPVPRKYMPIVRFLTDVLIRVQAVERHFGEGAVAVPPAADGFVDTAVPISPEAQGASDDHETHLAIAVEMAKSKKKAGRPKGSKNKAKDAPE